MAHTKSKGSSKLGRDSQSKRLGVKRFGSQAVRAGEVLVRQRGTKWAAGELTKRTGDDTIIALRAGVVKFSKQSRVRFDGKRTRKTVISIIPANTQGT